MTLQNLCLGKCWKLFWATLRHIIHVVLNYHLIGICRIDALIEKGKKVRVCRWAKGSSGWGLSWFQWHEATKSICTPPGWDASSLQGYPSIKVACTHLYPWVERGSVRVKCLVQEHNTMPPARAQTWFTRSGDEHINHEVTVSPWCARSTESNS